MGFGKADPNIKWCALCGGLWEEDSDKCTNPTCASGKKLGIKEDNEEEITADDCIIDDDNYPFIINTALDLIYCRICKQEWNQKNNSCFNSECSNYNDDLDDKVAIHEPDPIVTSKSKDVTMILMSILKDSGYEKTAVALKHRAKEGFVKYGTLLKSHNNRNAEMDALQESLDLNQYLFQCLIERDIAYEELKNNYNELLREKQSNEKR